MTTTYIIQAYNGDYADNDLGLSPAWRTDPDACLEAEIARGRSLGYNRFLLNTPAGHYLNHNYGLSQWATLTTAQRRAIDARRKDIDEVYMGFPIAPGQTSKTKGGYSAAEFERNPDLYTPDHTNPVHRQLIYDAIAQFANRGIRRINMDLAGAQRYRAAALAVSAMAAMLKAEVVLEPVPTIINEDGSRALDLDWLRLMPAMCLWEFAASRGLWPMKVPPGIDCTIWCYGNMTIAQMQQAKANGWQLAALGWGFEEERMRAVARIQRGLAEGDE